MPARIANQPDFVRPDTPQHEEVFIDALRYAQMQPLNEHWQAMTVLIFTESDKMLLPDPADRLAPAEAARRIARSLNDYFAAHPPRGDSRRKGR